MSDLRKLLDEGDEFERSLLDAGIDPDEDRAREERTLAALGLGGPIGPGPGDGGTGGAAQAGGAAAVGKWLALAAVGGVIVAGAIALRRSPAPVLAPAPPVTIATPAAVVSVPKAEPAPVKSDAPPVPSAPRSVVSRPAPSASAPPEKPTASTLAEEIRALDRARSALKSGDTVRARAELDRYDREFPFGSLGPEAKALRARVEKNASSVKKP